MKPAVIAFVGLMTQAQAAIVPLTSQRGPKSVSRLLSRTTGTVPLTTDSGFSYYADIALGASTISVIVDTGSSDLIVYGQSCQIYGSSGCFGEECPCTTPQAAYDPSTSAINLSREDCPRDACDYFCPPMGEQCPLFCAEGNTQQHWCMCSAQQTERCSSSCDYPAADYCPFFDQYGDGTTESGVVRIDTFSLAGLGPTNVSLGEILTNSCSSGQNCNGFGQASGLWGLAYKEMAQLGRDPAFDQLVQDGLVKNHFSLELTPEGGTMELGESYSASDYNFTAIIPTSNGHLEYYRVKNTGLYVCNGKKALNVDLGDDYYESLTTIVDSGTSGIVMPFAIYSAFVTSMSQAYPDFAWDSPNAKIEKSELDSLPDFLLTFDGDIQVAVTPASYMDCFGDICNSQIYSKQNLQDYFILGDGFMRQFKVLFDRDGKRIGFKTNSSAGSCVAKDNWLDMFFYIGGPVLFVILVLAYCTYRKRRVSPDRRRLLQPGSPAAHLPPTYATGTVAVRGT